MAAAPHSRSTVIVDELRTQGLPALAAEVPEKPGLFRVLVGPLPESEVDKTRAAPRTHGFAGDSALKRTF